MRTKIHQAVFEGNLSKVKKEIKKKRFSKHHASIMFKQIIKWSIKYNHKHILKYALDKSEIFNNIDKDDHSKDFLNFCLCECWDFNNLALFQFLTNKGAEFNTTYSRVLTQACKIGNLEKVKIVWEACANTNKYYSFKAAYYFGYVHILDFFICNGVNPLVESFNSSYLNSEFLKHAVDNESLGLIKFVLKHGGPVVQNIEFQTKILEYALCNKKLEIFKKLLFLGFDSKNIDPRWVFL